MLVLKTGRTITNKNYAGKIWFQYIVYFLNIRTLRLSVRLRKEHAKKLPKAEIWD